jgi:opacity protein-like surface antigen
MLAPSRGLLIASLVTALASATSLVSSAARAADMPLAPALDPIDEERVTFGSGWYLRGDFAISNDTRLKVGGVTLPSSSGTFNSWSIGGGGGYQWNNWVRTDVTIDWRNPRNFQGNTVSGVACQIGAVGTPPGAGGGNFTGSLPIYSSCSDYSRARLTDLHVLFNAYVDLGTWWGLTPYIGAGAGFSYVYQKASINWFMNNGNPYNPTWTDPFTLGTYSNYWDQARSTTALNFAWALMGGVSYAVMPHVSVDVGYRYLNLGPINTFGAFGAISKVNLKAQELRFGVRYAID